ncbi:MAG: LysR family transcriptional regulator [Lachnospiraceae bacterium]|nr:LysR family transcriptional regulator [Lachnospiraceae bacterium]
MNIQQLRYFTAVAQLQNMSRAADFLHVSQSALSKQIANLETELGVALFERIGKKILLNQAGQRFFESGNTILQELKAAEDDLRLLDSSRDQRIRIGTEGITDDFLDCLSRFAKKYPGAEFILNNRIEYAEHLNINDFDALICPDELRYEKLSGFPLFEEKYFFATNTKSPLSSESVFSPEMLKESPVIFMRGNAFSPEFPFRVCNTLAFQMGTVYFTDTRGTHHRFISQGIASGFVPTSESDFYRSDKNIRLLRIMDSRFTRSMKICFLREKHLSELGIEFRQFVMDYYQLEKS